LRFPRTQIRPSDFRSTAPVTPAAGDPLQRLTLPFEVYRDARPDLADLRLFNAKGEGLPIAFAGTPEPTRETPRTTSLSMFPLYSRAPTTADSSSRIDIRVKSGRNGTIVSVQESGPRGEAQRPIAWLLDATQLETPVRNLIVDWNSGPGLEVARITVEGSDDLKSWQTLASGASVLRAEQGGRVVSQMRVNVGSEKMKYLRLSATPADFVLRAVTAEAATSTRPAPRVTTTAQGKPGAKPGEFVYDLGARLPIEAVRPQVRRGEFRRAVHAARGRRPDEARPPGRQRDLLPTRSRRRRAGIAEGGGGTAVSALLGRAARSEQPAARVEARRRSKRNGARAAGLRRARRWTVHARVRKSRGEARDARANQLIPGYERLAELKLPQGQVGAIASGASGDEWWRKGDRRRAAEEGGAVGGAGDRGLRAGLHGSPALSAYRALTRSQTSGFTSRGGFSPRTKRTIWSEPIVAMLRRASCVTPAVWKLAMTLGR
jgi:hypothetical protein